MHITKTVFIWVRLLTLFLLCGYKNKLYWKRYFSTMQLNGKHHINQKLTNAVACISLEFSVFFFFVAVFKRIQREREAIIKLTSTLAVTANKLYKKYQKLKRTNGVRVKYRINKKNVLSKFTFYQMHVLPHNDVLHTRISFYVTEFSTLHTKHKFFEFLCGV